MGSEEKRGEEMKGRLSVLVILSLLVVSVTAALRGFYSSTLDLTKRLAPVACKYEKKTREDLLPMWVSFHLDRFERKAARVEATMRRGGNTVKGHLELYGIWVDLKIAYQEMSDDQRDSFLEERLPETLLFLIAHVVPEAERKDFLGATATPRQSFMNLLMTAFPRDVSYLKNLPNVE